MTKYPVEADKVGDRIVVNWNNDGNKWKARLSKAKTIAGARFAKTPVPHWTYPLNLTTCHDLRAAFGDELGIGEELWAWARNEKARFANVSDAHVMSEAAFSNAELEHLPGLAPTLYAAMLNRPYQLPAVNFLSGLGDAGCGDDPGLGKTLVSFGAMVEANPHGGVFLVLCPLTSIRVVWDLEAARWMSDVPGGFETIMCRGSKQRRQEALQDVDQRLSRGDRPKYLVVIANHEMARTHLHYRGKNRDDEWESLLRPSKIELKRFKAHHYDVETTGVEHEFPQLFSRTWDGVFIDEAHRDGALITDSGAEEKQTLARRGMKRLKVREGGLRVPLTGSMMKGKTRNLWGILNWTRPTAYRGRWNWIDSFFEVEDDGYGKRIGDIRSDRLEPFHRELSEFMIRRTKDELRLINPSWAPPPRSYYDVWCEMEPTQERMYKAMEANAVVTLGDSTLTATGVLAELTRLKQFASSAGEMREAKRRNPNTGEMEEFEEFHPTMPSGKFNRMLDKLEELGITTDGETNKVVIASQFTQFIELCAAELNKKGIPSFQITGSTSLPKRDAYQQEFQNDPNSPVRVMFLQTKTGGVSITLDIADDIFIMDETWIPDDQDQVEGRVHRTSNTEHQVNCWYFRSLGTLEEGIMETVEARDITQRAHLDGRRGVQYAKRLAEGRKK